MRTVKTLLAIGVLAAGSSLASAATSFTFTGNGGSSNFGPSVVKLSDDGNMSAPITAIGGDGVSGFNLDGYGVAGNGYRSIQGGETLRITFDQVVDIGTLHIRQWEGPDVGEAAVVGVNGTQTYVLDGESGAFNTNEYFTLNAVGVQYLDITGIYNGTTLFIENTQFFVAGLQNVSISEVPAPAAVWLFGSALVGLAGIARKRG